jgi:DNA-binding transcriptional ArsR family regulator
MLTSRRGISNEEEKSVMSDKKSKTVGDSMEETKERHRRYLRAMNSPIRRTILRELKADPTSLEELKARTGFDEKTLSWHLDILEWGYCVEKQMKDNHVHYILTKEGSVVDYVDK